MWHCILIDGGLFCMSEDEKKEIDMLLKYATWEY